MVTPEEYCYAFYPITIYIQMRWFKGQKDVFDFVLDFL